MHWLRDGPCLIVANIGHTAHEGAEVVRVAGSDSDNAEVAHVLFGEWIIIIVVLSASRPRNRLAHGDLALQQFSELSDGLRVAFIINRAVAMQPGYQPPALEVVNGVHCRYLLLSSLDEIELFIVHHIYLYFLTLAPDIA